jgi:UDP-N-acetylglucosamine diphosphorylase / glucose-1-phosphate thymidylyltransferase / UDP-N-acetylgalactosamine diphosphorylase / glucosamine-1-phosphate N-acetyltransferase / galactosamine-1-phosphate N-acetyltransferase
VIYIRDFIQNFPLPDYADRLPWNLVHSLPALLATVISQLGSDFVVTNGIAIHNTATIEQGVVLKAPMIISAHCFIGAHAYVRGGVFLEKSVSVGPGCEIKSSIIGSHSCLAHFNFVGDSIIGGHVNFEAGSITANYHNDQDDKRIRVLHRGTVIDSGVNKFGSLIGDHSKIGANAVLSPGTILPMNSIVARLALVKQV